ncbi:penicillin-binding protein 2 [Flavobacteriaceae bacterium]|jgi:penicillin-binding protein 2|nr:penicillin-binding protein 2 [Flavobacteriaceae bacterium]
MRKILLFGLVIITGISFVGRLFYLQIYTANAFDIDNDNAIRKVFHYPKRGYIYDRNDSLLVANQPSYDVMIIPREVEPLDTILFCDLLKIDKVTFFKSFKRAKNYSPRLPTPFLRHLSKEDYAFLSEKLRKFKGFYIQKRSLRDYQTSIGANVLGYIAEANNKEIAKDAYYRLGDLIGKQGVEISYEKTLRGVKGVKYIQKDIYNRDIGAYKQGAFDTLPVPGKDIKITIDSELQAYGELLMQNKIGGIVAIEPSTGEILSLVSAPSYNPNLLVGRQRSKNYTKLYLDTIHRPLIDKGLTRMHVPGSPFKLLVALAALQEKAITPKTNIICSGRYIYGKNKRIMQCHCGGGFRNLDSGISYSCNSYFAMAFRTTIEKYSNASQSMDIWSNHIKSFGLGNFLGNDLSVGKKGNIPNGSYYDKWYPEFQWGATTIISNAIGQGEILVTPIQLANMTAAIANKGHYYTPHIIKSIENENMDPNFTIPKQTSINPEYYDAIIEGMHNVYNKGTASFLKVPGIEICGKTGTAENFTKIDGVRQQLTDHSIFVAFAPKEDPKIAIAILVENGYYGSRWAGRMASLMIEKYIKGDVTLKRMEKLVIEKSLENEYLKPYSGKPFKINDK